MCYSVTNLNRSVTDARLSKRKLTCQFCGCSEHFFPSVVHPQHIQPGGLCLQTLSAHRHVIRSAAWSHSAINHRAYKLCNRNKEIGIPKISFEIDHDLMSLECDTGHAT